MSGFCTVLIAAASATPAQYGCGLPFAPKSSSHGIDASTIDTVDLSKLEKYAKDIGISQNNSTVEFASQQDGKAAARPHYGICHLKPSDFAADSGRLIARVFRTDAPKMLGFLGLPGDNEALIWLDRSGGSNRDAWRIVVIGTSTTTRKTMTATLYNNSTPWPATCSSAPRRPICLVTEADAYKHLAIAAVTDGFLQATLP